jgi:predicted patatin/cPLA2 family phospholipase
VTFDETTPMEELPKAVRSSSSIPGVFPPQHLEDHLLMDGGTVWNTNLISAVEKCMELVDDESKITLDIAVCSSHELEPMTDE